MLNTMGDNTPPCLLLSSESQKRLSHHLILEHQFLKRQLYSPCTGTVHKAKEMLSSVHNFTVSKIPCSWAVQGQNPIIGRLGSGVRVSVSFQCRYTRHMFIALTYVCHFGTQWLSGNMLATTRHVWGSMHARANFLKLFLLSYTLVLIVICNLFSLTFISIITCISLC